MAWISITESDVTSRLAGAEVAALKTAAIASGQTDPVAEIIEQVTDEVRGYIAANSENRLGDGQTVPQKLKAATLALVRFRLITRLPLQVSKDREAEKNDALSLLRDVASGRFAVEEPVTEDTEQRASPGPVTRPKSLNFTREQQDGL